MKILINCVLLLKAEKSDEVEDKYESTLLKAGFNVMHMRTLEFHFKDLKDLKSKLVQPDKYSGIIFTTPRSVKAVREVLQQEKLDSCWMLKNNYVVGETTYDCALRDCSLNCKGKESGNARNLAEVIKNDQSQITHPLLIPCGNLMTDTLINELFDVGIRTDTVIVYETVQNSNLEQDFINITSNYADIPEYFVYFSPSGVESTVNIIKQLKLIDAIKFIAIGPTTETALKSKSLKVHSVAVKPTPHDLLDAMVG